MPENALALKALETFKKTKQHAALAVDEYGVVQGLITIYDILEAIVGDIPTTDEVEEPMAVQRKDGTWLLDGLLPLDRFKEIFAIGGELPEEGTYQTLGGFILLQLGRIPSRPTSWSGGAALRGGRHGRQPHRQGARHGEDGACGRRGSGTRSRRAIPWRAGPSTGTAFRWTRRPSRFTQKSDLRGWLQAGSFLLIFLATTAAGASGSSG